MNTSVNHSQIESKIEFKILKAIRDNAKSILGCTPCSFFLVHKLLSQGGNKDFNQETVTKVLRILSFNYPNNFVIENEGISGYFLIFFHEYVLDNLITDHDGQTIKQEYDMLNRSKIVGINLKKISKECGSGNKDLLDLFCEEFTHPKPYVATLGNKIKDLTQLSTAMEKARAELVRNQTSAVPIVQFCESYSYKTCKESCTDKQLCSNKIHFERYTDGRDDKNIDDCSYLDTCFKGRQCRFAHYRIRQPDIKRAKYKSGPKSKRLSQQINADITTMDLTKLGGNYDALIIDPPWDIHTNPKNKNAGCTDQDVLKLKIENLQTNGIVFLWVTGRLLEHGRMCLKKWGYTDIEELVWIKTNQLNRTICTGRTGHWINHTKEHVLFARKGDCKTIQPLLDSDVMVSITRGKSKKPKELYGIIDRMVGVNGKKLELFGRSTNVRQGWVTVGNELGFTRLHDGILKNRFL